MVSFYLEVDLRLHKNVQKKRIKIRQYGSSFFSIQRREKSCRSFRSIFKEHLLMGKKNEERFVLHCEGDCDHLEENVLTTKGYEQHYLEPLSRKTETRYDRFKGKDVCGS